MSSQTHEQQRETLYRIAERTMRERGLLPSFSADAAAEVRALPGPATPDSDPDTASSGLHDQTALPWCSIDNDDSRDLDQLTVAETLDEHRVRIRVAIADVDALVKDGSAVDRRARHNTTSVYTPVAVFPMLPERLSTDLTSLNAGEERLAVVVEMVVGTDGSVADSDIYRARVRNHAKLAYDAVAAWLTANGDAPAAIASVDGLADNLRVQDQVAERLRHLRHVHGALSLDTIKAKPIFAGDQLHDMATEKTNRAKRMIEDFMIAANGVTARYLSDRGFPSIRRVVRTPKRWDRIVSLARQYGVELPETAEAAALEAFLVDRKAADPAGFADLSLSVVKLLGAGEYAAELPGQSPPGHFGLAVKDYAHSTAPNRRYPDLITQRLLKAAMAGRPTPYSYAEQEALATHFTQAEDAANKVERQVGKSAAAMLLQRRIGEQFAALVTGASDKGTWARLLAVPVEGRVVQNFEGADVGDQIRVQLISVNVERGLIDFRRVGR